jgi:acetyl-CoA C-acetyltransferase
MTKVVIVSAVRTAIGTFGGAFKDLRAPDLGYPVMREVIDRAGIAPNLIDDVIWDVVIKGQKMRQTLLGFRPLRQVSLLQFLPSPSNGHVRQQCRRLSQEPKQLSWARQM